MPSSGGTQGSHSGGTVGSGGSSSGSGGGSGGSGTHTSGSGGSNGNPGSSGGGGCAFAFDASQTGASAIVLVLPLIVLAFRRKRRS
jgi:hypothetical protein